MSRHPSKRPKKPPQHQWTDTAELASLDPLDEPWSLDQFRMTMPERWRSAAGKRQPQATRQIQMGVGLSSILLSF